jgi:hypothetical protein
MASVGGHVQVQEGVRARVLVALWRDGQGRHEKTFRPTSSYTTLRDMT